MLRLELKDNLRPDHVGLVVETIPTQAWSVPARFRHTASILAQPSSRLADPRCM